MKKFLSFLRARNVLLMLCAVLLCPAGPGMEMARAQVGVPVGVSPTAQRTPRRQEPRPQQSIPAMETAPLSEQQQAAPAADPAAQQPVQGLFGPQYVPPTLQFRASDAGTSLFFHPLNPIVDAGKDLDVAVAMVNRTGRSIDSFTIGVAYDPAYLHFKEYDISPIEAYLDTPDDAITVRREAGRIFFSTELSRPLIDDRAILLNLRFSSTELAGRTDLRFAADGENPTSVRSRGVNVLGNRSEGMRGLLDSIVNIRAAATHPELEVAVAVDGMDFPLSEPRMQGWVIAPPHIKREAEVGFNLWRSTSEPLEVGDEFWVDLVLENENALPLDRLAITLYFDPTVLQVLDTDRGNWITRDVNILDGDFRSAYPFDLLRANRADNTKGVIHYDKGRYQDSIVFPSGVFARIHFRCVAPAEETIIGMVRTPGATRPETVISSYGVDRLEFSPFEKDPPKLRISIGRSDSAGS